MDLKLLSLTIKVFEPEFEFEFSHYIYSHITEKFKEIQQVGFKTTTIIIIMDISVAHDP